jgi:hypothetical protein
MDIKDLRKLNDKIEAEYGDGETPFSILIERYGEDHGFSDDLTQALKDQDHNDWIAGAL